MTQVVILWTAATTAFGQGWVGQYEVSVPETASTNQQAAIATDASGTPWVVWHGYRGDTSLLYARWLGDRWAGEHGVGGEHRSGPAVRLRPALAFDHRGCPWVVYDIAYMNNTDDIGSRYWTGDTWSSEIQVNVPDSTELDYVPRIACGGGRVWCVWFGRRSGLYPDDVYASFWDSAAGAWSAEMRVNPPDGNLHWNPDVAVDAQGRPHVVWLRVFPYRLMLYSYYDGTQWSEPQSVNDTCQVRLPSWIYPRVVIDRAGSLHAGFVGVALGARHRDVFCAAYDGAHWQAARRVSQDSLWDESDCAITANGPTDVWAMWNRYQAPGGDGVYAAHYDAGRWGPEMKLDSDGAFNEGGPETCLDSTGLPWVVWDGFARSTGNASIYGNRYAMSAVRERATQPDPKVRISAAPTSFGDVVLRYSIPCRAGVRISVVDAQGRVLGSRVWTQTAGTHDLRLSDLLGSERRPPPGVSFCRLQTLGVEAKCKVVLLSE